MELTLRTSVAFDAAAAIRSACPEMRIGIGTILSPDQVVPALAAGAEFGVSPGVNPEVIRAAAQTGMRSGPTSTLPDLSVFSGSAAPLGSFFLGCVEWGEGDKREARRLFKEFLAAPGQADMPYWETYRSVARSLATGS